MSDFRYALSVLGWTRAQFEAYAARETGLLADPTQRQKTYPTLAAAGAALTHAGKAPICNPDEAAAAAPTAGNTAPMHTGMPYVSKRVWIKGLASRPDLNGTLGRAIEFVQGKGRYKVALEKAGKVSDEVFLIKAEKYGKFDIILGPFFFLLMSPTPHPLAPHACMSPRRHTRHVSCATQCPCLLVANGRLRSDHTTNPRPQAFDGGG